MKLKKLIGKIVSLAAVASIAVSCLPVIGAQAETKVKTYVFASTTTAKTWTAGNVGLSDETKLESDKWSAAFSSGDGLSIASSASFADRNGSNTWLSIKGASNTNGYLMFQPYTEAEAAGKIIYFNFDYAYSGTNGNYMCTHSYIDSLDKSTNYATDSPNNDRLNASNVNGSGTNKKYAITVIIDNINYKTYYYIDGEYKNSRLIDNGSSTHTAMIWRVQNNAAYLQNVSYGEIAPSNFINGSDTIVAGAVNTYTSAWTDTELGLPSYKLQLAETPAGVTFSNGTLKVEDWTEATSVTIQAVASAKIDNTSSYPNSPIAEKVVTITKNSAPESTVLLTQASADIPYSGSNTELSADKAKLFLSSEAKTALANAQAGDYMKVSFKVTVPDEDTAFHFQPITSGSGRNTHFVFNGGTNIDALDTSEGHHYLTDTSDSSSKEFPVGSPLNVDIYFPLQAGGKFKSEGSGTMTAAYDASGTAHTLKLNSFSLGKESGQSLDHFELWYRDPSNTSDYTAGKTVTFSDLNVTLYTSNLFSKTVNAEQVGDTYVGTDGKAQAYKADFALETDKTYAAPTVEWQVTNTVGTYRRSKTYTDVTVDEAEDSYYGLVITYGDDDGYIENPTVSATFESASVTDTSTN